MKMILPASKYSEYRQRIAFVDQVLERVKVLPGVLSAGTTTNIPLEREIAYDSVFSVEGRPPPNPNDVPITSHRLVSPDYLKTLGVTLIKGRLIDDTDRAGKPPVVVVSEELARQAWPGEDPLGKRIKRVRPNQDFPWMTVIGVVKDVKEDLFNYRINRPVWYVPYTQLENNFPVNLVVRTSNDPANVTAVVREAIHAVDPDQPVSNVMTMNENLAGVLVTERFSAILMSALAASGLLLAALGLYGVMAYSVSQRTAEIGVRVALGAQRIHVLQLILGHGAKLTLLGVAIGVAAAWALMRLLAGLLFEVNATDPATFLSISLLLVSIALIACLLPARRALSVDPVIALRAE
jgi:putative ABC transport system permease protein